MEVLDVLQSLARQQEEILVKQLNWLLNWLTDGKHEEDLSSHRATLSKLSATQDQLIRLQTRHNIIVRQLRQSISGKNQTIERLDAELSLLKEKPKKPLKKLKTRPIRKKR